MKTLIVILSLITLAQSASANQSARITLSAQNPAQSVNLVDERYEPIYEQQPYQDTCSREVFDHTATVCNTYTDNVCSGGGEVCTNESDSVCNSSGCHTVPRRVCHSTPRSCVSVPRRSCSDHSVYRTEYFSCTKYRTVVVGQRLVKTFQEQIEVAVEDASVLKSQALELAVSVNENSASVTLLNSFSSAILTSEVQTISENDSGSVLASRKRIVIRSGLSAEAASQILGASLEGLELDTDAIQFDLPGLAALSQDLSISIELIRDPLIGGNTTLYSGTILSSKLSLVGQGRDLHVNIPLQKLGVDTLSNVKYDLAVSVSLASGNVLNARDLSATMNKRLEGSFDRVKPL